MTSSDDFDIETPEQARELFGASLPRIESYVELLSREGVRRGLIGPREVPRLWERHVMNCAVVEELIPWDTEVVDLGSGAGLPGIVLAILRPDLRVTLLEPLLRRTVFLQEAVDFLELDNAVVWRGRAEEQKAEVRAGVVTARAVAPLTRLARWALPLLRPGGMLLALKGEQAEAELKEASMEVAKIRPCVSDVVQAGAGKVDPATTVIQIKVVGENADGADAKRNPKGRRQRGRKR